MTTIKDIKTMIADLCERPAAKAVLEDINKNPANYNHVFTVGLASSVAFVTYDMDSDEPIGIGFKAKANKADYQMVYDILEAEITEEEMLNKDMDKEDAKEILVKEGNRMIHHPSIYFGFDEIRSAMFSMLAGACPNMKMTDAFDLVSEAIDALDSRYSKQ